MIGLTTLTAIVALLGATVPSAPPSTPDGLLDLAPYRGKVVYLDFWASWCRPCRSSFQWMNRMHERYADDGLVILAVSVDGDPENAQRFLERYAPVFATTLEDGKAMAAAYDLDGMPSSFIFDRNGRLRVSHVGFRDSDGEALEGELKRLLSLPVTTGEVH